MYSMEHVMLLALVSDIASKTLLKKEAMLTHPSFDKPLNHCTGSVRFWQSP